MSGMHMPLTIAGKQLGVYPTHILHVYNMCITHVSVVHITYVLL